MRSAVIYVQNKRAGLLTELDETRNYRFQYDPSYAAAPVSLTMPVRAEAYEYKFFPPFFEGLLPEGIQLESLLRQKKIDKTDLLSQLIAVGEDLVGAVQVRKHE